MSFKHMVFNKAPGSIALVMLILLMLSNAVRAASFDISQEPLFKVQPVEPLVMLSMSNDQQLYFTAYPDYADLTGDGQADRGYVHSHDYYGYFDSHKCYSYSSGVFSPVEIAMTKYCSSSNWSGNFLNWVSMARIDVVRKILYGGYRSTDTAAATVLERTYLPNDAHSWVKYYDGADISQLTPFSLPATAIGTSNSPNAMKVGSATDAGDRINFTITWSGDSPQSGDQFLIRSTSDPSTWMMGVYLSGTTVQITSSSGVPSPNPVINSWTITNESRRGVSFCNTTVSSTTLSQNVTDPPLLRVAKGNYSLWAANERWQCRWSTEKYHTGHPQMTIGTTTYSNGNILSFTGTPANADNPVKASVGLGLSDYTVRVNACVSGWIGDEKCKQYPDGNIKPVGLLQEYGDDEAIYFGLLTGSYTKNKSGGVLRKDIASMIDEVNVATNGTFKLPASGYGIINALNKLRIYGYRHDDGTYFNTTGSDNCSWGWSSFSDGQCTNWGNPQSEIFLEALRYFTGAQPDSAFAVSGNDKISGLVSDSTWGDPLTTLNWCATLNILNFNASVPSYDNDQFSGLLSSFPSAGSITALTDIVGAGEGIHGQQWFIGSTGGSGDRLCTAKTISSLGAVSGPCPEGPRLDGTYHIAGLAHYAYTHDIRTTLQGDQLVKTYGVTLAPAVPRIAIPKPGETTPSVTILPACQNKSFSPTGNCAIVDFKVISQDLAAGTGSFLIQWEDSEQGGDYDMDMNGILRYQITSTQITVTTNVFAQSTPYKMALGYVISGTTRDGFHAHSGINDYDYTDTYGGLGCSDCVYNNSPTSVTYSLGASSASLLKDPLFYAAKWAGYNTKLNFPTDTISWDSDSDGLPDNYYYAVDPAKLAEDMEKVFLEVKETKGSATAVAANSTSLNTNSSIYQAKFNSEDWSGQLLAFRLNPDGTINGDPNAVGNWDTQSTMISLTPNSRHIFTITSSGPAIFEWSALDSDQQRALADNSANPVLTAQEILDGQNRLNWIRGEQPNGAFRQRNHLLGDIVNSNPYYVGAPNNGMYTLLGLSGYDNFRSTWATRTPMVYVGANDGMLHAFDANTGAEKFAYVPKGVFTNLASLTKPDYTDDGKHKYFVDGSPVIDDAEIGGAWKTILIGATGAGGRSIFALDVTDPDNFSTGKILWEFSDPDLGYTLGRPVIARVGNNWVLIVGNGYNSDNHRAVLFVLNLETGAIIHRIDTGVGDSNNPNGLASPGILPDLNGKTIAVYAGDMHGNLWKFDPVTGVVAFSGAPLFKARDANGNPQPITAGPEITRHPNGGYLVFFGTGKYFETTDQSVGDTVQSLYGIWDQASGSAITYSQQVPAIAAPPYNGDNNDERDVDKGGVLQRQEIITETSVAGNNFRVISKNPINWANVQGWYMDLIVGSVPAGERVIDKPILDAAGRAIFTSIVPYDIQQPCDPRGTTWVMAVDMLTGGRLEQVTLDINRDSQFDEYDKIEVNGQSVAVSGFQAITAGISKATLVTSSKGVDVILSGIENLTTTASATSAATSGTATERAKAAATASVAAAAAAAAAGDVAGAATAAGASSAAAEAAAAAAAAAGSDPVAAAAAARAAAIAAGASTAAADAAAAAAEAAAGGSAAAAAVAAGNAAAAAAPTEAAAAAAAAAAAGQAALSSGSDATGIIGQIKLTSALEQGEEGVGVRFFNPPGTLSRTWRQLR